MTMDPNAKKVYDLATQLHKDWVSITILASGKDGRLVTATRGNAVLQLMGLVHELDDHQKVMKNPGKDGDPVLKVPGQVKYRAAVEMLKEVMLEMLTDLHDRLCQDHGEKSTSQSSDVEDFRQAFDKLFGKFTQGESEVQGGHR